MPSQHGPVSRVESCPSRLQAAGVSLILSPPLHSPAGHNTARTPGLPSQRGIGEGRGGQGGQRRGNLPAFAAARASTRASYRRDSSRRYSYPIPRRTTARSEATSENGPLTCHHRKTRQRSLVLQVNSLRRGFEKLGWRRRRRGGEVNVHGHRTAVPAATPHAAHRIGHIVVVVVVVVLHGEDGYLARTISRAKLLSDGTEVCRSLEWV